MVADLIQMDNLRTELRVVEFSLHINENNKCKVKDGFDFVIKTTVFLVGASKIKFPVRQKCTRGNLGDSRWIEPLTFRLAARYRIIRPPYHARCDGQSVAVIVGQYALSFIINFSFLCTLQGEPIGLKNLGATCYINTFLQVGGSLCWFSHIFFLI